MNNLKKVIKIQLRLFQTSLIKFGKSLTKRNKTFKESLDNFMHRIAVDLTKNKNKSHSIVFKLS